MIRLKNPFLSRAENILDMQTGTFTNLPNIMLYGTNCIEIDNFTSLLDFSADSVRLNTKDGILKIDGTNLTVPFMTDDSIRISGNIRILSFE